MSDRTEVVVLIHGIRTHAPWAEMVKRVFSVSTSIHAIPIGYGYFDVVRFLFPGPWRRAAINKVTHELHAITSDFRNARISILAHSFGTYIVSNVLMDSPDIRVHRLCLCGSIVDRSFHWKRICPDQVTQIVNDCGTRDIWPLMASGFSVGYGASGTFGFRSSVVVDRFHRFGHSDFFSKSFAKEFWLPYFEFGEVKDPEEDQEHPRSAPPMWQNLLSTAKYWLGIPCLLAAFYLGIQAAKNPPPGFEEGNLSQLEVGFTKESFVETLGQPKISVDGTFKCGKNTAPATYARWNNDDVTTQAIFIDGDAQIFTVHLMRAPVRPSFQPAGVNLGFTSLGEIGEHHMGWFNIVDARYPAYAERHYFGASGDYLDYFFGLESGELRDTETDIQDLYREAEASTPGEENEAFQNLRWGITPMSVAISTEPTACEDSVEEWYNLNAYLAALPPEWAELRFLESNWSEGWGDLPLALPATDSVQ